MCLVWASVQNSDCNRAAESIKNLKSLLERAKNVARLTNNLYLCTRKSAYCAGSNANNTLIKSNLAFKNEVVEVPF